MVTINVLQVEKPKSLVPLVDVVETNHCSSFRFLPQ